MRTWILAGVLGLAAQTTAPSPTLLRSGSVVDARLQAGAPDSYRVELGARDFLHVIVEQRSLDVVVRLVDPAGATLFDADSRNGGFGFERIAFIAPRAGGYQLQLRTPSNAPTGSYRLEVRALRPATDDDVRHEAAERGHLDADRARRLSTAEGRRQAVARYREAADAFRALGLDYEYALTLFSSGITHLEAGEPRAAVPDFTAALPILQKQQDQLLPSVLNGLGGAYDIFGEFDRAMAAYREALSFFRSNGNLSGEGVALNNIGKLFADQGDWQAAIDHYRQALVPLRKANNSRTADVALTNMGVVLSYLGDADQALDQLAQALEHRKVSGDKPGQADTLSAMGVAEAARGNLRNALEDFERALQLRREVGDRRQEAVTLKDLGRVYLQIGEPERALTVLEPALAFNRASGDRRGEAQSLGAMADAYGALRQNARAIEVSGQALAIFRTIGDREHIGDMLFVAARAERDLDQLDAARRDAEAAIAAIEDVRGRVATSNLRTSYFARQHDVSTFLVDLLMRLHDRQPLSGYDRQALEASERGRARSLLDSLADSGAHISRGADSALVERDRRIGEQLNVKAERRLRLAARPETDDAQALDREIRALESEADEVRAAIRRTSPAYAALTQPHPISVADMQRDVLDDGTLLLQYSLGAEASYLWAVDRDSVVSYRLPPEAAIGAAVRDVHSRVTGPRGPAAEVKLRAAVAALSRMVIAPAAARLNGRRLVVVPDGALQYVPFAMLTMPAGTGGATAPLVAHSEIVTLPSASALAVQRTQIAGRPRPPNAIAVLADPVFDARDPRASKLQASPPSQAPTGDETRILAHIEPGGGAATSAALGIPRLPFTNAEATAILRAAGSSKNLQAVGFDATKDLVLSGALAHYRFVHFATHGVVDAERADLSAIVLSLVDRDGKRADGFLRVRDIYNLDLPADVVVLSACETGLGREIRGEGLVGLMRGFMYAGAARVVVSLWSVSDRATATLMGRFYEEMLTNGKPPAAALRAAQLAMSSTREWRNPYFWAGFVIEGEWR